jgi:hypothetical protein
LRPSRVFSCVGFFRRDHVDALPAKRGGELVAVVRLVADYAKQPTSHEPLAKRFLDELSNLPKRELTPASDDELSDTRARAFRRERFEPRPRTSFTMLVGEQP